MNTTLPTQAEKELLIRTVRRMKTLMASGDVAKIRAYLMTSQGSDPAAAKAFTTASDDEIKQAAAEIAGNPITDAEFNAESTQWKIDGNIATITIHRSASEEVELTLRNVDGTWY